MTWAAAAVGGASLVFGASQDKKARKREAEAGDLTALVNSARDKRIADTQGQIDRVYASPARQQQYTSYGNALRGYYGEQLGRRRTDEARNLKFALAKGGQTGGSVAVDSGKRLGDEFYEAALGQERNVQGSVNALKNADEQQRLALRAQAGQGLSVTQGASRGLEAQRSTLAAADSQARSVGLGDVFTGTAATYRNINERAALQRGLGYNARRSDLYGRAG